MPTVQCRIAAIDTEPFPGWAAVEVSLAGGGTATIREKLPVLGIESESVGAVARLECLVEERVGQHARVRLLHGVETVDAESVLLVQGSVVT
ncbi:hypothetical protein KMZ32_05920 [Phycicoccus sp. MAQZ13P-2]|uniref:hypothetical protein n=1 Tax=Phycicoccus mangrovi TaxID=2840470 RepID=UPI001C00022D|nr:hypothetical protein [Phycicoccus mangrovi]MBT9256273.1 hypothetical protein [Phycicoccus mangrovi]MBT9273610.1 hypothetical protein [Phycicoccus mangrovi]